MGLMSLLSQVTSSSSSLPNSHLLFFSPALSLQPLLKLGPGPGMPFPPSLMIQALTWDL